MTTNVRLIVAIALSLGVVLLFGLLSEKTKDEGQRPQPAVDAAVPVEASSSFVQAPPGGPPATPAAADAGTAVAAPSSDAGLVQPVVAAAVPDAGTVAPVAPTPPGAPAAAPETAVTSVETREKLENGAVTMRVSSRRGAIVSWKLKDGRFAEEVAGATVPMDLAGTADGAFGLYCYDAADVQGNYADVCPSDYGVRREGDRIVLDSLPRPGARVRVRQTYTLGTAENPYIVRRSFTMAPAEPGQVVQNLVVWVSVAQPAPHGKPSGGFLAPKTNQQNGLCYVNDEVGRTTRTGVDAGSRYHGVVSWVGVEDTYFLSAFGFERRDPPGRKDFCVLDVIGAENRKPLRATLQFAPMDLAGERVFSLIGHLGPKSLDLLRHVPALSGIDDAIDYGWFGPVCVFMLRVMQFFQSLVSVWGVAIILLTVLVKLVLLPLTHWSMVSMRRMSALKPLLDEINAKYQDDKQRKNQAVMELYKTHKVNPLGGCFPILIQMPIWIALYRMLGASAELYHVSFLYLPDLTSADPYYVLPIVLGISMFVQQKMTPTTVDSSQAKIMLYGMPIMFTVFMLFLPSGLNLYIFTNTVLSIVQQQITNRFIPPLVLAAAKGLPAAARATSGRPPAESGDGGGRPRRKK